MGDECGCHGARISLTNEIFTFAHVNLKLIGLPFSGHLSNSEKMSCFGTELVNNYLSGINRSPAHISGDQLDLDASILVHYYTVYSHRRLISFIGICPAASNIQPTRGRFHITAVDELSV